MPCAPYNVSAVKECGADAITVAWSGGSAIFYVAVARDSNGVVHSCNSMDQSCKIEGLRCSTNYTAYVLASNFMCNSSESEAVTIETGISFFSVICAKQGKCNPVFQIFYEHLNMCPVSSSVSAVELALWFISAPCPPDEVIASLDCAANEALISWRGQLDVNSYTAIITDEDQGLLSCSSINTSCSVPNLKCSQLYTVTVSHHDGICPSMPSQPIYMESGSRIRFSCLCRYKVFGILFF